MSAGNRRTTSALLSEGLQPLIRALRPSLATCGGSLRDCSQWSFLVWLQSSSSAGQVPTQRSYGSPYHHRPTRVFNLELWQCLLTDAKLLSWQLTALGNSCSGFGPSTLMKGAPL